MVHRLDIQISADDHQAMLEDLDERLSSSGPDRPDGPGDPGVTDLDEDPIWVPVTLSFEGLEWTHVGMRYKGNSSLQAAWQSGVRKLAFRLNFDMYEDKYPEIDDQRFYGFQKMTFSNGYKDSSLMRDKLAGDLFRAGGVPVARSAFAAVYVDHGEGPVYFGLYTMIEDPSDAMLDSQFEDGSGNLYKPEEDGASWESFVEAGFYKKTNEDSGFEDIQAAIAALLASQEDAEAWREGFEPVFDVYGFLRMLAINQVMVNWDSYGCMPHNYYIYADPAADGQFAWIPWDLNESLMEGTMRDCFSESILLDEIGDDWPLIRKLLDDEEYRQVYLAELQLALDDSLELTAFSEQVDANHALIEAYVVGPEAVEESPYTFLRSSVDFENSTDELKQHLTDRHAAVNAVLGNN